MGMDDNFHHRILDDNLAIIETPLIGPLNSHIRQHFKTALYPYNVTKANNNHNNNNLNVNDHDDDNDAINPNGSGSHNKCRYLCTNNDRFNQKN
jgi:hypothetical protein